ncbi:MAG: hypothetical protein AB7D38_11995 [Sulfurimonas sp.]|uniref:hypothetical protein n=1 Tax=Sulfurimonas sp. TaxID=2022749 RepID=UPI003D0C1401
MSKTEIFTTVSAAAEELFNNLKVKDNVRQAFMQMLEENLKPKKAGSVSFNPPVYDEELDCMTYFCRFHQRYEAENNMVMANGKSKGYCKASIAKWTKAGKIISKKEAEVTQLLLKGEVERAKELVAEVEQLKLVRNEPTSFNFEEDWAAFDK